MSASPTRISELTQVSPQSPDQIPIARGFGAGGQTLKITVGSIVDQVNSNISALSANTIYVNDSPTIDLTYNSATRVLSADLQKNLDLRDRTILMPAFIEIPPGCIMPFAGKAAPEGWLICNGQIVPNGTGPIQGKIYDCSRLWTVLGTTYGTTPGTLPDLRGYFIRGYGGFVDPNVGVNADGTYSGAFGQKVEDSFQGHKHGIYDPQHKHQIIDPTHNHTGSATSGGSGHTHGYTYFNPSGDTSLGLVESPTFANTESGAASTTGTTTTGGSEHSHALSIVNNSTGITQTELSATNVLVQNPTIDSNDVGSGAGPSATRAPSTSFETKPKNIAMLYCIKV